MFTSIYHYIGGHFEGSEAWLPSVAPATGQVMAQVARGGAAQVQAAVAAAQAAFPAWAARPESERAGYLLKIAQAIEQQAEALALAESLDTGKPLALARRMDIPRAVENFRFFATAILHQFSESHATAPSQLNYTLRQPLGVVGCISPWNLPLYLFTWKIAPALAAGNCVVAKPSELAPLTAFKLAQICVEVGLPPGVLNLVQGLGPEAGQALVEHPQVKAISFTGGTATGRQIALAAAPQFKKLSLEMGGKNPFVVFANCDWEATLATALRAGFTNQGQICLCGPRMLVERSVYPRFRDELVARVRALRVGDPLDPATDQGALISAAHRQKVLGYVQLAQAEGGTVLTGGEPVTVPGRCAEGYFMAPTVIEGLGPACRTNQEEIFGPVVTLQPFDNEAEAIALANATSYGLAASVHTNHLAQAHRVAAQLESGIVWLNGWLVRDLRTPFGGVKNSGLGREGGFAALRFFTEEKNVWHSW
ncbi:MAG: aldehyde dehydrogenase [Bernardetiaceae bacterium]|jgi:aminomuconate-semialdehyde/2-hydroxymuconate-6-semialdehyde dehydrogenase|nr:aldehyde dehydrogenase [Bernardetiaceae bacterium]